MWLQKTLLQEASTLLASAASEAANKALGDDDEDEEVAESADFDAPRFMHNTLNDMAPPPPGGGNEAHKAFLAT